MDREIPKSEIKLRRRKRIAGGVCGGIIAMAMVIFVIPAIMRKSISREDLKFGDVERGTIETTVHATGRMLPAFEEIITSPIASRIVEVYGKVGDSVQTGTPLLRLDLEATETELNRLRDRMQIKHEEVTKQRVNGSTTESDIEMQIRVKDMEVKRLRQELANERYLDSLGSGTGERVREVELAYNTGMLVLQQLQQQLANQRKVGASDLRLRELEVSISGNELMELERKLEDARIRAPREAILTYINDQIGHKVAEGEQVAIISDLSHFRVEAQVADAYADRLTIGAKAVIRSGKGILPGTVTNIQPQSTNGVITFSIRLDNEADNSRLRSGLKADVYVADDVMDEVVRVKNGSYYTGPGNYEMFVCSADGNTLTRRNVRLGESNYDYVEVTEGLEPGERVVISDMKEFSGYSKINLK